MSGGRIGNTLPADIIGKLVLSESWQQEEKRETAQPALMGDLSESLDRAFVLGGKRAMESLTASGYRLIGPAEIMAIGRALACIESSTSYIASQASPRTDWPAHARWSMALHAFTPDDLALLDGIAS